MKSLNTLLDTRPFEGYLYAYPHKTAYRKFDPPLDLQTVWAAEDMSRLFLYLHIPFCEMRCGFCNLFTLNGQTLDRVGSYIYALRREVETYVRLFPHAEVLQIAIGGGTPTFLNVDELQTVFELVGTVSPDTRPFSIETSPGRTTPAHLDLMQAYGVTRISIGVESFSQKFLKAMGRPEKASLSVTALDNIRARTNSDLNIDLIYGHQDQSEQDFVDDIARALHWSPEEVFLYPLYVGPLTGLKRTRAEPRDWDALRLRLYRAGRDTLLHAGYHQTSQRRFAKTTPNQTVYSCQEDGMIGLGAGARSYTRSVHYSWEYAVGRGAISDIISDYAACEDFSKIKHGVLLSVEEEQRRYIIKSILNIDGLNLKHFRDRFGADAISQYTELQILIEARYLFQAGDVLAPTALGLERADAMGPFMVSDAVSQSMENYQWA